MTVVKELFKDALDTLTHGSRWDKIWNGSSNLVVVLIHLVLVYAFTENWYQLKCDTWQKT